MRSIPVRVLALLAALVIPASAQIRSGTLVGKVTDPSGAAAPAAEVVIRNTGTNYTWNLKTNQVGEYTQPYLPFGTYNVSVKMEGFKAVTQEGITISTGQTVRADLVLEVGSVETSVSVSASAVELQTESSRVTNAVTEQVIRAIPNINNNPLNYATLQLGVVSRAAMNDTQTPQSFGIGTEGRRTFSNFQVNGGAAFSNDVQLDGVSIQASAWNEVAVLPNTEGIQEVRTTVNNMSAEYGRSNGTVIITTRSGSNEFHGSGQFRLRNEALNANTFANNASDPYVPRAPFKVQNYSGTLGGPVLLPGYNGRDKTFFFVSYEGLRFNQGLDYFRTVPTALERRGDFSQTLAQVGSQFVPVQVYDPFNVTQVGNGQYRREMFADGIIPANRINAAMQRLANEYPLPNRTPDDPTGLNNYYNRMTRTFERDSINTRVDHRLSSHSLYGTFGSNIGLINSPNGWGEDSRGYTRQGGFVGAINGDRNYYGAIGDTWIISPTLIADVRVGLTRVAAQNRATTYDDLDYTQFGVPASFAAANGLPGAFVEAISQGGGWSRLSGLNDTSYFAKIERQTNWNVVGSLTKNIGRWTHKWGGEFRNYLSNYTDARGSYMIRTGANFTSGNIITATGGAVDQVTAERSGSGLASYLLGAGDIQAGENNVRLALSAKYFAGYMQSDWRATDRLTVNLGLRYDVQPGPTERYGRVSAFSYSQTNPFGGRGALVFPGAGESVYKTPWKDFGPRVGLAWRVTDDWVVRSGFGVTYLPTNTGYFGGPFYFGSQNFALRTNDPVALQYGPTPAGRLLTDIGNSTRLNPIIGANPNAPQYYGSGDNEPRFDYDGMQNGKMLQWNFFIERRLAGSYIAQVGYTGTHGYRLQIGRYTLNGDADIPDSVLQSWRSAYIASNGSNPATQQVTNPFQPDPNSLIPFSGTLGNRTIARRNTQFAFPYFPANLIGAPTGFQNYNALMAQLQRSYSNGLLFNIHYTWSKTADFWGSEAQMNQYLENSGFTNNTIDRRNYNNSYALSANDIPHRLVATALYELPFGRGRAFAFENRVLNGIFGGWNIGSVVIAQSGQPQAGFGMPPAGGTINGLGDRIAGVPVEVPKELQRWYTSPNAADRTVTLPSGRQVTVCRYCFLKYSSDAFAGRVVQFPNGTYAPDIYWFGTAAPRYGDVRTPGRFNVNMSLQKELGITERVKAQFSAEASNLLNNAQFRPAINAGLTGTFTNLTAAQTARGLKPGMVQNDNFGTYGMSTFDPRQIELRVRLFF